MSNRLRNLYIITARAGSKGVKNKNIQEIDGLPLIAFKAISAKKSSFCDKIIISTDSEEIAEIAMKYGVEAPFLRPKHLAEDSSSSVDVLLHAVDYIETNCKDKFDTLTLLEPSSPFTTYEDLNRAFEIYKEKKADSVIGMKHSISSMFIAPLDDNLKMSAHFEKLNSEKSLRRQDTAQEYTMNGAVYICGWDFFKNKKSIYSDNSYGYIMKDEYSVEIDTYEDLRYAEYLYENLIDKTFWSD